jgi:hypothetical protein
MKIEWKQGAVRRKCDGARKGSSFAPQVFEYSHENLRIRTKVQNLHLQSIQTLEYGLTMYAQ